MVGEFRELDSIFDVIEFVEIDLSCNGGERITTLFPIAHKVSADSFLKVASIPRIPSYFLILLICTKTKKTVGYVIG